jgi:hypothetical protein
MAFAVNAESTIGSAMEGEGIGEPAKDSRTDSDD